MQAIVSLGRRPYGPKMITTRVCAPVTRRIDHPSAVPGAGWLMVAGAFAPSPEAVAARGAAPTAS
jgi:hypothetical protein